MSCREHIDLEEVETDPREVVQSLIARAGNPARLLECYYWAQEPGLPETIRALLAKPVEVRTALLAFCAAAVVPSSITASVDATGTLTLRSPEAAAILPTLFSGDTGSA